MTQNRRRDYRPGRQPRGRGASDRQQPTKADRRRKRHAEEMPGEAQPTPTGAAAETARMAPHSPFAGDNRRAALAMAVICPVLASLLGNMLLAATPLDWFTGLEQPRNTLPTMGSIAVSGLVYLGYGVVVYRLWRQQAWGLVRLAILVLAANEVWSIALFGLRDLGVAIAATVLFAGLVTVQVWRTWPIDRISGGIAVVYWLWLVGYEIPWVIRLYLLNS